MKYQCVWEMSHVHCNHIYTSYTYVLTCLYTYGVGRVCGVGRIDRVGQVCGVNGIGRVDGVGGLDGVGGKGSVFPLSRCDYIIIQLNTALSKHK